MEAVKGLQRLVAGFGFNPGPIDGIWGTKTEDAWQAYMEAALVPGGGITYETTPVVSKIIQGG